MALKIVIGWDAKGAPFPVYCGESGSDAKLAMEKDTKADRFESFSGIIGVRKSNPNGPSRKPAKVKP
jgi:hypothetical protein